MARRRDVSGRRGRERVPRVRRRGTRHARGRARRWWTRGSVRRRTRRRGVRGGAGVRHGGAGVQEGESRTPQVRQGASRQKDHSQGRETEQRVAHEERIAADRSRWGGRFEDGAKLRRGGDGFRSRLRAARAISHGEVWRRWRGWGVEQE